MSMALFLLFFLFFFLGMFLLFSFSLKRQEKNQEELLREQKAMRHALERLARLVEKTFEELPVQEAPQRAETEKKQPQNQNSQSPTEAHSPAAQSAPEHLELGLDQKSHVAGKSTANAPGGLPELKL